MTDVNTYRSSTPLAGHRQHVSSPYPFGTPASQAFTRTAVNTSQVRSPLINPGFFTCTCTITHIATFTNYIMRAPGTLTTSQFTNLSHQANHSQCHTSSHANSSHPITPSTVQIVTSSTIFHPHTPPQCSQLVCHN